MFTDDYSCLMYLFLIQSKSDTFQMYTQFKALLRSLFKVNISTFYSDKGGEYMSDEFKMYLKSKGTVH